MMEEVMEKVFTDAQHRDWRPICRTCSDSCCGCYPLPGDLFERFEDRIQVPTDLTVLDSEYTMPMTPDHLCPFLARHDRVCVIYPDRPAVCRLFGEIPELPCPMIDPAASKLLWEEMVERVAGRLGIEINMRKEPA